MPEPIRIDSRDLFSAEVESYIETTEYLRRDVGELTKQSLFSKIIYSSWFYLSICCGVGALLGWAIIEPFFDDFEIHERVNPAGLLIFPTVAAGVGLFLGAAEGIMCRHAQRCVVYA